jgi:SNF2 family DNA or RNA helicase
MAKLRHIVGVSKVPDCVEFASEFLISNEGEKLVIFTEHTDVADLVKLKLNKWLVDGAYAECLHLHSGLSSEGRQNLIEEFKRPENRIMIAATKAAGEGLNLQFCSNAVLLERQWNPANEEQAEDRFHRFGQKNAVSIYYMIESGTIDEYFSELVEQKRAIVSQALDKKEIQWEQSSLIKELAELLVTKDRKKWSL